MLEERKERLKAFEAAWARTQDEEPGWPYSQIDQRFNNALNDWLMFHKCMLIGELIPRTLQFLRANPENEILQRYTHVFIDEYQDLNRAEQSLLDLLSENASVTVIGDEDQSIYETLKYAHPEGISKFHLTHAETTDIPIEECRRCPTNIVSIANSLIQHNINRDNRALLPRGENGSGEIHIVQWLNLEDEIVGVINYVSKRIHDGEFDPGEVLILSPRRHIGYLIRDGLREAGIDAHSFFREPLLDEYPKDPEKCQALEAFSLLLLLENPDDAVALRCWLGYGSSSLRSAGYKRVRDYAASQNTTTIEVLNSASTGQINLPHISSVLDRYRELRRSLEALSELDDRSKIDTLFPVNLIWAEPYRILMEENLDNEDMSVSNVIQLITQQATQPELPMDAEYVRIMSLQKSKGLSADHVVVTNCVQGIIPAIKSDDPEMIHRELEEQRRLFYVAITRSKKTLLLTNSSRMPFALAKAMGVDIGRRFDRNVAQTIASQFINDLGPTAPKIIRGEGWDQ